jgi:hypothetical protein
MKHFTVQIVEHVNHVAYVEADSKEEAEQLAVADVNSFDWTRMDGGNSCEVCLSSGDYEDTDNLKESSSEIIITK